MSFFKTWHCVVLVADHKGIYIRILLDINTLWPLNLSCKMCVSP